MVVTDGVLGVEALLPLWIRLIFAALTTVWLGFVFSYILDGRQRFRQEREALISEAVAQRLSDLRQSQLSQEVDRALNADVHQSLAGARADLDRVSATALLPSGYLEDIDREWLALSTSLTSAAEAAVRPLSHRLWQEAEREHPRPRAWQVAKALWRRPVFLPFATAVIIAIGLPGASVRGFGNWAPIALTLLFLLIYLLLRGLENTSRRRPELRRPVYLAGVLFLLALVLAYSLIPGDVTDVAGDAASIVIGLLVGVFLTSAL